MERLLKQLAYGIVFAAVIGAALWAGYRLFVPAPSCTDGIQNQGEEGVDCGAACGVSCPPALEPLVIAPVTLLANSDGSWDALAEIGNSNAIYGASRLEYQLQVRAADGAVLATREGSTFANALQSRLLVFPLGTLDAPPAAATLTVDPALVEWMTFAVEAAGQAEFAVRGDALSPRDDGMRFAASVVNRSRFDFDTVDVVVLLEDARGETVAAGTTVVLTLRSGEERGFVVDWPFAVPDAVRARAVVNTNLFSNDNYIREYGTPGRIPGF